LIKQKTGQIKSHLGETVYLMRKAAKISQVELGNILSLHQTAICRIEQGFQSLMIEQLYTISQFFGVKMDALVDGEVDYWKIAQKFNQLPPLPDRYAIHPYSKVREVLPSLKFLERRKGAEELSQILNEFQLPKAFFLNPNLDLGVNCHLDFLRHLIKSGELNQDTLKNLTSEARSEAIQGFLHPVYESQINPVALVQTWVLNSHHYEKNFQYVLEDPSKDKIDVSVTPEKHMKDVDYQDDILGNMLCEYKKNYFTQLAKYSHSGELKVTEKECHFRGGLRCVYQLSTTELSHVA